MVLLEVFVVTFVQLSISSTKISKTLSTLLVVCELRLYWLLKLW
jgi:hypothetical protein